MNEDRLCILVCKSFQREIESIAASSAYPDVEFAAFPDRCAHPSLDWADIRLAIGRPERFRQICIIGGCCLAKLDSPPEDLLHAEINRLHHCFGLLLGEYAIDRYVQEGAYLVTPGWLETWRQRIAEWGFDQATAREFFGECCRKIILLDTGVPDSFHASLEEFTRFIDRPFAVLPTGLDLMRLSIENRIQNWRCERESSTCSQTLDTSRRQVADYAMAFDLLSSLTRMDDEEEVVRRILAFYSILFDADDLAYVPVVEGEPGKVTRHGFSGKDDDELLKKEAALLDADYRLLESQAGFLLKICHHQQHLGVIRIEGITLARYRDQYLNLAISTAGVCGLALNNARSFQRIREITRQLQASEERFRTMADSVPQLAWAARPDGHIFWHNRRWYDYTGTTPEQMEGWGWQSVHDPLVLPKVLEEWRASLATGNPLDMEFPLRGADGNFRRFLTRVLPVKDPQGRIVQWIGTSTDITDLKQAEQEREVTIEFLSLVNSSTAARNLVSAAATFFQEQSGCHAVGIRLMEGDDFPYYEARGFPKEFILAENTLCSRDDEGQVIRDICGNPEIECMCGNVICGRFDPSKPFFTTRGSFWTNGTTELLAGTTEGDRQARTRNRCNGEGYESVALIPLNVGQERLGLLQLNDRRTGQFSPEAIGLWEMLSGYLAIALVKLRTEEALAKANEELELRVAKRTKELEKSRSELKMQNEELIETYRKLEQETAERIRTMEELRQKDQLMIQQSRQAALGEMIGNIAHQWRQPLNSLGLLVQQVPLFYKLGEVNEEFVDTNAKRSMALIQHMSRTIDDFRSYFKPDKEKVEFRAREAVEKALSLMEGCLNNQRISIEVDLQDDPLIYGYPNEFSQVLLNILINAKDALVEREIAMPKVLFTLCTHENRAVLTIADNAGGIPVEIIGKIFDPYFTTKGPQEGTGVGLFMSKTIIEKNMGGLITVRNVNGGAEFRIETSLAPETSNFTLPAPKNTG